MSGPTKVFLLDDSITFRMAMARAIAADPELSVVGEAAHPREARSRLLLLSPDVMVIDDSSFSEEGGAFIREIQRRDTVPVVAVGTRQSRSAELLCAGASTFLCKPVNRTPDELQQFAREVAAKVKVAAHGTRARARQGGQAPAEAARGPYAFQGLVALGASTGGTQSTAKILRALPEDFPGIVIVQHMPPDFTRMYAESLDRDCRMRVREARDGDAVERGLALIAPGDRQMRVVARPGGGWGVACAPGEKVNGHCPSVDVLFFSVARCVPGRQAVGVILTGMGADGARGITDMRRAGAYTIGQDEATSVVYGMPREAYEMGGVVRQAGLHDIAGLLMQYARTQRR